MILTLRKCNEKLGSPCFFTRQQALKMEYFYRLRVKSLNHLHTDLSHGYLKDAKFYLESIASFKLCLITWLPQYCTFLDSSVVN